jgi:HAD superfamily hydrolase (TIGR01509 family)
MASYVNSQPVRAVIFDVDGTLVDSERDGHRVAFNRAFAEAGLPDRWDAETYGRLLAITGGERRLAAHLRQSGRAQDEARELARRLHARKTEIFSQMAARGEIAARPGALELLEELRSAGLRLAIATTGTRAWVKPLLERLFGRDRFEVIVTGDEAPVRKPDPSAYLLVLELMGLAAAEALAVEDSEVGLRAARAAGIRCAVVVNDYTRAQDFSGAALVLDGFAARAAPGERMQSGLDAARLLALARAPAR